MLFTQVLMAICGTMMEGLNNEKLRSPVDSFHMTIQFLLDGRGEEIDAAVSRRMSWVDCELVVNQLIRCEQVGNPRQWDFCTWPCAYLYKISFYGRVNA